MSNLVEVPEDLIEEIQYRLRTYDQTSSRANAGHHLIELHNAVSDLSTYHTGYDDETGTLPWERQDD